jgi:hypothetical protein
VNFAFSQEELTQTIRGKVIDKDGKSEIPGVNILLFEDSLKISGAVTDVNGNFRMENIPVGKYSLKATFLGYLSVNISSINVGSIKEVILNFSMEESAVKEKEVVIEGERKGEVRNDMAIVSARSFSPDETSRYAGSRTDPARMASNFAGVQGTDDSENEIVIRGNSSLGLLWRLEGVNIPNPNHFAIAGATSGAVNIINSKVLDNSDFYTGAFPAEFGNCVAGVFDLRMKNGNNEQTEFTAQVGILGAELAAEGPINKQNGSSYLVTYRYSTLGTLNFLHIPIGTDAIPKYQDAAFKLNFPGKKGSDFSVFGVGRMSNINLLVSTETQPSEDIYGEPNQDQYIRSGMGVLGASYTKSLDDKTFFKVVVAHSIQETHANNNLIYRDTTFALDSIKPRLGYQFLQQITSFNLFINHKFSSRTSMNAGIFAERYDYNLLDSNLNLTTNKWVKYENYVGSTGMLQPYIQFKIKASDQLIFTGGLHAQYFLLNGSSSIEPRAGMKWKLDSRNSISAGFGMHSEMQPAYIYFEQKSDSSGHYSTFNKNLGFTRSIHYVLAYEILFSENLHIKTEVYYQHLYDAPVDTFKSSYSLVNQGTGYEPFYPGMLANKGTGTNYGVELTIEKFFSKSFFFMITGSLFNSTYKGSDGVERNTDFNERFANNFLLGKDFKIGNKNNSILTTGTKVTWAGGARYSPADIAASNAAGQLIPVDSLRNTKQFKNYFRWDITIGFRFNRKKITHEIGLDIVNLLNTQNVLTLAYSPNPIHPTANPITIDYQLGLLPIFYYKIDF